MSKTLDEMIYIDERACNELMGAIIDCEKYYKVLVEMEDYNQRKVREQVKMATYALNMTVQIIGEQLNKLSERFRNVYIPEVDVEIFYRMRNIISHSYESINMRVVKAIVHEDLGDIQYGIQMFLADLSRETPYKER